MGALRLFLAVSVLVAHAGPLFGFNLMFSDVAVKLFFIISGFYMSLVLSGKYEGKSLRWTFYTNRFLRLYPAYLLAILITGVLFLVAEHLPNAPEKNLLAGEIIRVSGSRGDLDGLSLTALLIPNFFIVGSDVVWLFHHSVSAGWEFTFGILVHHPGAIRGGNYLLIPPGLVDWRRIMVLRLGADAFAGEDSVDCVVSWGLIGASLMDGMASSLDYLLFLPGRALFFLVRHVGASFLGVAAIQTSRYPVQSLDCRGKWSCIADVTRVHSWLSQSCGTDLYGRSFFTALCVSGIQEHHLGSLGWQHVLSRLSVSYSSYRGYSRFHAITFDFFIVVLTLALAFVVNYFVEEPLERYRQRRAVKRKQSDVSVSPAAVRAAPVESTHQAPVA